MPDGSDATAFSRWLGVAAERRIPNKDVRALERLIRGDSDQARLSGTLEAPADALEIVDRSDGIAIGFPDGDRILIRAHKGRLQVRHEGGLPTGAPPPGPPGLPPAPQITANTGPAVEAFNRSLASTGRRLASIDRLPSGEVRIQVSR